MAREGAGPSGEQLPGLPPAAFDKMDPSPDAEFYDQPRFVTHIDDGAIAAVTRIYRETLPAGGALLDVMSSWVSHLPEDAVYASVTGHGMNAEELAANPRLSRWFVQDLNVDGVTRRFVQNRTLRRSDRGAPSRAGRHRLQQGRPG